MTLNKSPSDLTQINRIDTDIKTFLTQTGEVFKVFNHQDSGCISYGVKIGCQHWFVKESSEPRTVESFHRAIKLHSQIVHPVLPCLHNAFETPIGGLALVYDWLPGEIIYNGPEFPHETGRKDPKSAHARFCTLPVEKIIGVLNTIYDLHRVLADAGFIAVDFYDGCVLYDFEVERTYIIDLDEYRRDPFINPTNRLFGSARFMAPEEFQRGAQIDQSTNVFTLGRAAIVFLANGDIQNWRANAATKTVIEKATRLERVDRYPSVAAFVDAWETALT